MNPKPGNQQSPGENKHLSFVPESMGLVLVLQLIKGPHQDLLTLLPKVTPGPSSNLDSQGKIERDRPAWLGIL